MSASTSLKVLVLMGGDSREREISLLSGAAVARALTGLGHAVEARTLAHVADVLAMADLRDWDVVFPALHGGMGEDGRLQALLDVLGVPYALSGHLASAVAMDKAATKRILRSAGIPTPDWLLVTPDREGVAWPDRDQLLKRVDAELRWPVVVKPNADGSSVGVRIVTQPSEFAAAFDEAAAGGRDVLLETYVPGRELTAAILLGRRLPLVEIVPREGFYDFGHKYTAGASDYLCPAPVHSPLYERLSGDARRAYDLLGCRGVARVDFRLDGSRYACLEVNTIPGMTDTSLVPKAAAAVGITFADLVDDLCRDGARRAPVR